MPIVLTHIGSNKGYTTSALVNSYLGGALTAAQLAQADALVEAAENVIDRYTGRSWLTPIVDELYPLSGPYLYLRSRPVASVQAVKIWDLTSHALQTLTANDDYETLDLERGWMRLFRGNVADAVHYSPGEYVGLLQAWVSYTPANLPAEVQLATTMLVADWLAPAAGGVGGDVKSYSVGGELSVTRFDRPQGALPPQVAAILKSWRGMVFA